MKRALFSGLAGACLLTAGHWAWAQWGNKRPRVSSTLRGPAKRRLSNFTALDLVGSRT
jgi:hypothetical protein